MVKLNKKIFTIALVCIIAFAIVMMTGMSSALEDTKGAKINSSFSRVATDFSSTYIKDGFNEKYGAFELSTSKDGVVVTYSLISISESIINLEMYGKAQLYKDGTLFDDVVFKNKYGSYTSLKNSNYLIKVTKDNFVQVEDTYKETCVDPKLNETKGEEKAGKICYTEVATYKTINQPITSWQIYKGEILKAGTYEWKFAGTRSVNQIVDIIPVKDSMELKQWAWFNNSWNYRKSVTPNGIVLANSSILLSFDRPANMNSTYTDLRFLNSAETLELPYYIEFSNSTFINVSVRLDSNATFYMYYGTNLTTTSKSNLNTTKNDLKERTNSTALSSSGGDSAYKGIELQANYDLYLTQAIISTSGSTVKLQNSTGSDLVTSTTYFTIGGMYYYQFNYPLVKDLRYRVVSNENPMKYSGTAFTSINQTNFNATNQIYDGSINNAGQRTLLSIDTIKRSLLSVTYGTEDTNIDISVPVFSLNKDNNGTLFNSGLGTFNITIANTNGSVFFEIAGVNRSTYNISSIFFANYTFTNNGTYSYKWHAFGNGTETKFNSSSNFDYYVGTYFNAGNGTIGYPYEIADWFQLNRTRNDLTAYYKLVTDINSTSSGYSVLGNNWLPIGSQINKFTGNFNGNNKTIKDIIISGAGADFKGLFAWITGSISNLKLENVNISGQNYVGAVAGVLETGKIYNCYSSGNVSGRDSIGGLIGSSSGLINNSRTNMLIVRSSNNNAGGLVGENNGYIYNSYSMSNVTGISNVGGFAGLSAGSTRVYYSFSTGVVTGTSTTGGLIGNGAGASIVSSYWDTQTSTKATSSGGTGKTTAEMKTIGTYSGWDISATTIKSNNGYPFLGSESPSYGYTWFIFKPLMEILEPLNNSYTDYNTLQINYTYNPTNVTNMWWSNNSGLTNHSISPIGTNISTTWSQGWNNITLYINFSGVVNYTGVNFFVDSINPRISFVNPINGSIHNKTNIQVNYTYVEANPSLVWYTRNNGATNITLTTGANISGVTWNQGWNNITLYINDSLNHINSTSLSFYTDSENPGVQIITPIGSGGSGGGGMAISNTSNTNFTINFTDTAGVKNGTFIIWNNATGAIVYQTNISSGPGILQTYVSFVYTLMDSIYKWMFFGQDFAGNLNATANTTLLVDTAFPIVNIPYPTATIPFFTGNTNMTFNFTATDTNLDSCWFTYSGITYPIACGKNYSMNITTPFNRSLTYYANDSVGHIASITRNWEYGIYYDSSAYLSNVIETQAVTFATTYASSIGISGISLFYKGVEYPATLDTVLANVTIDIPVGVGNNTFFWRYYYTGTYTDSPTYNQSVSLLDMRQCGGLDSLSNVTYLNVSFQDSSNLTHYNASINMNGVYYLGSGIAAKSIMYVNTTPNYNYLFCAYPNNSIIKSVINYTYSGISYPSRTITNVSILTNVTTHLSLWNIATGQLVTFIFSNLESGTAIKDVGVAISEVLSGIPVSNGLSDSIGKYSAWVDTTLEHKIAASKTGCKSESWSFIPNLATYSLTLDCGSSIPLTNYTYNYLEGVTYRKAPASGLTPYGPTLFEFDVRSSKANIYKALFQLVNNSGSVVASIEKTKGNLQCNATLCYMNLTYNVTGNLKGSYYVDLGYGYQTLESDSWYVAYNKSNDVGVGLKTWGKDIYDFFANDLTDFKGNPSDHTKQNFTRIVFFMLLGVILVGLSNRVLNYDAAFPGSMAIAFYIYILIITAVGGISGHGLLYIEDFYTGASRTAGFMNNWIIAIFSSLTLIPYIAATFRRNQQ